jgi:drug/metabolite transporter (DMT)-like permease
MPVLTKSGPLGLPLLVLVAVFCLIWSSAFAVSKLALADAPPLLLLTARFLFAGMLCSPSRPGGAPTGGFGRAILRASP